MTQFESLLNVHFDSDQERALMHIMCSGTQIFHEMELLTKKFKLKVVHFHILLVLKEGQGIPLNLKTIKARIIDKRDIDSKPFEKLVEMGYVEKREVDPEEPLQYRITTKGLDIMKLIEERNASHFERIKNRLNPQEARTLNYILQKMLG